LAIAAWATRPRNSASRVRIRAWTLKWGAAYTAGVNRAASKIPADRFAISSISIAELALEVSLLAQDHAVVHDHRQRHEDQQPPCALQQIGQPEKGGMQPQVERIARVAERSLRHQRGGGAVGRHVGARAMHGGAAP